MALILRLLKAEQITAQTTTELYLVPTTVVGAVVHNVRIVNKGTDAVTLNLYFRPNGGSQVRILDKDLSLPAPSPTVDGFIVVKPEITMATGDKIELVTSLATGSVQLDYVVCGVERT